MLFRFDETMPCFSAGKTVTFFLLRVVSDIGHGGPPLHEPPKKPGRLGDLFQAGATSQHALDEALEQIGRELHNQYLLAYAPNIPG